MKVGDKLRPLVAGRTFVMVGDSVAALVREAEVLLELGAGRTVLIGDGLGLAEPPDDPRIPWGILDVTEGNVALGRLRAAAALNALPVEIAAWLDSLDPTRAAQVFNYSSRCIADVIAGRTVVGATRQEWIGLDDKTSCDAVWEAAGIRRAPSGVVAVERDALKRCSAKLDRGQGTVWAGDARDGVNSGAHLTRWIRNPDDMDAAVPFFFARCDRLRIMPFIEGIPCSIHAIVTDEGVGILRPCETFVLRTSEPGRFRFAGMGTTWDPDDADRNEMRTAARRVAELLGEQVGYRGTFTLDGVLGEEGFVPTELNPRVGRALMMMNQVVPDAGLVPHAKFLSNGQDTGLAVADIEEAVLGAIERRRVLSAFHFLQEAPAPAFVELVFTESGLARVPVGQDPDAVLHCGPAHSYTRGMVSLDAKVGHAPIGPAAGWMVAEILNRTRDLLSVSAGRFAAPEQVR